MVTSAYFVNLSIYFFPHLRISGLWFTTYWMAVAVNPNSIMAKGICVGIKPTVNNVQYDAAASG
jgi:hypothetical protein